MPQELVSQSIELPSGELRLLQPQESAELPDAGAVEWAPIAPYWSVLWRSGVALARELEAIKQLPRPLARHGRWKVKKPPEHLQVLQASEQLVHRGGLTGQTDELPHRAWLADDVAPEDVHATGVRPQQRRENADEGGLSRAVGPQEAEHRALLDSQGHAREGDSRPEALDHAFREDGRSVGRWGSHRS